MQRRTLIALSMTGFPAVFLAAPDSPDKREKIKALFFTASWCGPCRAVYPVLRRVESKYPDDLTVLPVDFDSARDEAERWGVHEIPVVIVISPEGSVLLRSEGADPHTLAALQTALERSAERRQAERRKK